MGDFKSLLDGAIGSLQSLLQNPGVAGLPDDQQKNLLVATLGKSLNAGIDERSTILDADQKARIIDLKATNDLIEMEQKHQYEMERTAQKIGLTTENAKLISQAKTDDEIRSVVSKMGLSTSQKVEIQSLKYRHELEKGEQKQRLASTSFQEKTFSEAEKIGGLARMGRAILDANPDMVRRTPDLDSVIAQLRQLGETHTIDGFQKTLENNADRIADEHLNSYETISRRTGIPIDDSARERIRMDIKTQLERSGTVNLPRIGESEKNKAGDEKAAKASADAAEAKTYSERKARAEAEPVGILGKVTGRYRSAADAPLSELPEIAAHNKSVGGRRAGLAAVVGIPAAAMLLKHIVSGPGDAAPANSLPPEVLMALMKNRGRSGGGGEGGGDDGVSTGRDLNNLVKTVGLLRQLQSMGGAQGGPAVASLI